MFRNAFVSVLTLTIYMMSTAYSWADMENVGSKSSSGSLGGMFRQTQTSFTGIGNLILGGAFLSGIAVSASGLMKLKAAADSQGRDPHYSDGLIRLAVGAALCSLPNIMSITRGTITGK